MKTKYITVLNHIDGEVYQHTLPPNLEKTGADSYIQLENWLIKQDYSLGNIEWMVHKYPAVQIGCPNRNLKECECEQCCENTN